MNWGRGLAIALIAFAGLMIYFVAMAARNPEPLVTERYYEEELVYQDRIDAAARANSLSGPVLIEVMHGTLQIAFPNELSDRPITGELTLVCMNDPARDRVIRVAMDRGPVFNKRTVDLRPGRYNARLSWAADGRSYYHEQKLIVQ